MESTQNGYLIEERYEYWTRNCKAWTEWFLTTKDYKTRIDAEQDMKRLYKSSIEQKKVTGLGTEYRISVIRI